MGIEKNYGFDGKKLLAEIDEYLKKFKEVNRISNNTKTEESAVESFVSSNQQAEDIQNNGKE